MNPIVVTPPLEHPRVTIGGLTVELKKTLLSEYVLDTLGVDSRTIIPILANTKYPVGKTEMTFKVFTALVAHNFTLQGKPIPSVEYWLNAIEADPNKTEVLGSVVRGVYDVITKELEKNVRRPAAQDPPAAEPAPNGALQ